MDYKPIGAKTLVGSFTLRLDPIGLTIYDCLHHRHEAKEWVAFPGRPYQKDGETRYARLLDFSDRSTWDTFQRVILQRLQTFISARPSLPQF